VIEIMRFRLSSGVDRPTFLAADRAVQEDFAYQQPGLLRRTTARADDDSWIVIDMWQSGAESDACSARWDRDPVAQRFMSLVDRDTLVTERYTERD
jgi:hypothetical protein